MYKQNSFENNEKRNWKKSIDKGIESVTKIIKDIYLERITYKAQC